jgi:hypothetical protein
MATYEKTPTWDRVNLIFTLPLAAATLLTLKEFITQEFLDAEASLFNGSSLARKALLRHLDNAGWKIAAGSIHAVGANDAFIMSLPYVDLDNEATRPSGANVVSFGVQLREPAVTDPPLYLPRTDADKVLIYSALGTSIAINFEMEA